MSNLDLRTIMAEKYNIQPDKFFEILTKTAFKQSGDGVITREQMAALLVISHQYDLNPFTREIYAFPHEGGIVTVIGIDEWAKIVNNHSKSDGIRFEYGPLMEGRDRQIPTWIEAILYRKDRSEPIVVREYFDECSLSTKPWASHPKRMLRHKAFIQAARIGYGFTGVYDPDEAEVIISNVGDTHVTDITATSSNDEIINTVKKVADRARGNWGRAIEYLNQRYANEDLQIAIAELHRLREKSKSLPVPEEAPQQEIVESDPMPLPESLENAEPQQEIAEPIPTPLTEAEEEQQKAFSSNSIEQEAMPVVNMED